MLDNIRWILSVVTSVSIVWFILAINQTLPQFINTMLFYGTVALTTYVLSEVIYSELTRLKNRFTTQKVEQKES